jgi:biopolymer transport protein TolR
MGMSTGGSEDELMAEINVTPFVDVMLVLLIIFMVTTPMMTAGLEVDLPKTEASTLPQADEQVILSLTKEAKVSITKGEATTELGDNIGAVLAEMARNNPDQAVFIKADGQVPYEEVARLLSACTKAGIAKVGMVTDPAGAPRSGG